MRFPDNACGTEKLRFKKTRPFSEKSLWGVTQMSFDIRAAFAQNSNKRGRYLDSFPEPNMPAYEICYLDEVGALTYKFTADCDDDQRAKILAHAMKLPSARKLEE